MVSFIKNFFNKKFFSGVKSEFSLHQYKLIFSQSSNIIFLSWDFHRWYCFYKSIRVLVPFILNDYGLITNFINLKYNFKKILYPLNCKLYAFYFLTFKNI